MVMEIGPQENNLDWKGWEICQEAQINLTAAENSLDIISLVTSCLFYVETSSFPLSLLQCV